MRQQRNYYEILGIARTASPQEIRERYRELARKYHPDRASDKELAQRIFTQVNRSYTTLSNPEKRAVYDVRLIDAATAAAPNTYSYSAGTAPASPPAPAPAPAAAPRPQPEQIRQWLSEANAAQHHGNVEDAIRLCRSVLTADPRNFPGLVLLGDLLARQGRHGDALVQYECAEALHPNHREVCDKIARLRAILARKARAGSVTSASAGAISSEIPPAPDKPAAPKKSLIDLLMNRGK